MDDWRQMDDPTFAMWRQPGDQRKRDTYGAIVDGVIRRGLDAPSVILFWTWGQAAAVADGDLNDTNERVKNGYQELRKKFLTAGFRFVRIKWLWGIQFSMWVVVPKEQVGELQKEIELHCNTLSGHIGQHGCRKRLLHPAVEVIIDSDASPSR